MKFAKTIRFDKSDLNVFENASEEAEWAISGAFEFSNDLNENLIGKRKQSLSHDQRPFLIGESGSTHCSTY